MRSASAANGLPGLLVCLIIGIISFGLGVNSFWVLSNSYQLSDILYDEGPDLFQAWIVRSRAEGRLTPEAVSRRLSFMPINERRATVNAMMSPTFWTGIGGPEELRKVLLETAETGLIDALSEMPSAGDLWLAASYIRSRRVGFDKQAEIYLATSYLMAPREAGLARSRLVFAESVSPMLRVSLKEERDRDLTIVRKHYPGFEKTFQNWLNALESRSGAKRDAKPGGQW